MLGAGLVWGLSWFSARLVPKNSATATIASNSLPTLYILDADLRSREHKAR